MKQLAAIVGLTIICSFLNTWAVEEQVSFSGTWIQDTKKSDAFPRPIIDMGAPPVRDVSMGGGGGFPGGGMGGGFPGGGMGGPGGMPGAKAPQTPQEPAPMVIQQSETEMNISSAMRGMDGKEIPIIENYKLDGKELVAMIPIPNSADKLKQTTKATLKKNKFKVRMATSSPIRGSLSGLDRKYSFSNA